LPLVGPNPKAVLRVMQFVPERLVQPVFW